MKKKQYIHIMGIPRKMTKFEKIQRIEKLAAKMNIKIGGANGTDKHD